MNLVWQSHAKAEFRGAAQFYRDNAGHNIAGDFSNAVISAAERLREFPDMGARIVGDVHRILLRDYPYSLIYRKSPSEIIVIALAHQRQRPGYWRGRR